MNPLSVIVWTCVAVFVITAALTLMHLSGIRKLADPKHANVLFGALVLEVVAIALAAFSGALETPKGPEEQIASNDRASNADRNGLLGAGEEGSDGQVGDDDLPTPPDPDVGASSAGGSEAESHSLRVSNGDLLAISGDQGIAVVALDHRQGCAADYQWRFKPQGGIHEQNGVGEVFEQYGEAGDGTVVTDVGGQLYVRAGPFEVQWSCGGSDSGWVYRNGVRGTLSVFPSRALGDFRL